MNLHNFAKAKTRHNVALTDLDWMQGGFAVVVDDNWLCVDNERGTTGRNCYVTAAQRGHVQDCLRRAEGVPEHERLYGLGEGIYLCECECHTENHIAVYATYLRDRGHENHSMYGRIHDEGDRYLSNPDYDLRRRMRYWCRPCRQSEHHWTE